MKRLISILIIFVGGTALTTVATADDADDVKAAHIASLAALNAGDVDAYAQYRVPQQSGFYPDGGLLEEFDRNGLKAALEAGLKFNLQHKHLDVKVYDNAAVTTGYETGTVTYPDGTTLKGPRRYSAVWINQAGQWKLVHLHISMITAPQQ